MSNTIARTNVGKLGFGETTNYKKKNYISIRYNFVSVGSLLNLFVYAQVRLRHKNHLARVKKTLCFGLKKIFLSATNMAAGVSPSFVASNMAENCPEVSLLISSTLNLTNVGMQTGTAVTGLAALLPRTPPPSPIPTDMKVG